MNTLEIGAALAGVPHFRGVFAVDRLPRSFRLPAIFVINLDAHHRPGTHWVSVAIDDTGNADFMDSFGRPPSRRPLVLFLRMHAKQYTYNTRRLQGVVSNVCGQYCCLFALRRSTGVAMHTFVASFSKTNFCANDAAVLVVFRECFGDCRACDAEEAAGSQTCLPEYDIT